jgi:type II secretory pathway pseudopilin PulG
MKLLKIIRKEEGYTLLETVVAMALFVAVLIPLGSVIGNLMLDKTSERLRTALQIAQSEMNRTIAGKDFTDKFTPHNNGLSSERKITREGNLIQIAIKITSKTKPDKNLLVLNKNIIDYQ